MNLDELDSDFLRHIVSEGYEPGDRIPSLGELSATLNISVGKLREQMEAARTLGIVDARPRTGMRLEPYDFLPAVRSSLLFAIATDPKQFEAFSLLRNHIEFGFWDEAVALLTDDDKRELQAFMTAAWAKLNGSPIQIPHAEHRQLHLTIFQRLNNPFVKGLLEAYWEGYEAVELNNYSDYEYMRDVWNYHQRIVDSILGGQFDAGREFLIEHTSLLKHRVQPKNEGAPNER